MATESAGESELSVSLPPALYEWLDERAAELDIEREALLVQLLETHRSAADLDDDGLVSLFESADIEASSESARRRSIEDAVDDRLDERGVPSDVGARIERVDGRIDDIEAELAHNVEDIRDRVLQLRDAVEERAPDDHGHEEFEALSDRLDELSAAVDALEETDEAFETELDGLDDDVGSIDDRLRTAEDKLDRLARALVAVKRRVDGSDRLDELRRTANRLGVETAACGGCEEAVRIGLLSAPRCPHCDRPFGGLEPANSMFGWFGSPTLTVSDHERADHADERRRGESEGRPPHE